MRTLPAPALAAGALLLALAPLPAAAQQHHHGAQHGAPAATAAEPHGGAMHESMRRMQEGMDAAAMSGDPDVDFARMMIPHHQGAVDMARAQLEHGKDPRLRQLAQEIVESQEREIAILEGWLAENPR